MRKVVRGKTIFYMLGLSLQGQLFKVCRIKSRWRNFLYLGKGTNPHGGSCGIYLYVQSPYLHLLTSRAKKHIFSSDSFPSKPTGERTILEQTEA